MMNNSKLTKKQVETKILVSFPRIFFIGFMGVGKTFLGKQFAEKFDFPFYDIDLEIEKKANLDVTEIFRQKGEEHFRELESEVLLNWDKDGVIATGGGIIESERNREFLKSEENKIIWLNPSWEIIRSRLINSYRPIVVERTEDELFKFWDKRVHLYKECADLIYDGSSLEGLIKKISKK